MIVAAALFISIPAEAGPPFLTDDPVPVDYGHSEFYVFSTYDKTPEGKDITLPAFEYNYGVLPETQLHVMVPFVKSAPSDASSEFGLGDVEVGVKYRFVQESSYMPQIGVFPMVELATGNADRGLGNGKPWWRLPVWLQKSWGEWTSYGGGGYVINHEPGTASYSFGGLLLQRDIGDKWTLGGELFARSKDADDGERTTLANVGGYYKFTADFNLLFTVGHSVSGEKHTLGYVGLWWAFGGDDHAEHKTAMVPGASSLSMLRQ